jgi:hypothetical protein
VVALSVPVLAGVAALRQHALGFLQGCAHGGDLELSSLVAPSKYLKL